jgi:hypothetical protein
MTDKEDFGHFDYFTKRVAETYFLTMFQSNLHTESKA